MSTSYNVPTTPHEAAPSAAWTPESGLHATVSQAVARTRRWLLDRQWPDGAWCAELEGDTILESETILVLAYLGREHTALAQRAAAYLLEKQLPGGGWAMYPGGAIEISGSVKAYFALKVLGHDPEEEYMQRARRAIREAGGADAVNSFTRFFLALLGQISYDECPAVPPQLVLLPRWFPVNLYGMSAWSRTIVVPLSIVSAQRPVRQLAPACGIRELFLRDPKDWPALRCPGLAGGTGLWSWDRFFRGIDRVLRWGQRHRLMPFRGRALAAAQDWMLARFESSDGLGAIFPPIIFSLVALKCLGYDDNSPPVAECFRQLEALVIENHARGTARLQPCKSPVWDTAIAVRALSACAPTACGTGACGTGDCGAGVSPAEAAGTAAPQEAAGTAVPQDAVGTAVPQAHRTALRQAVQWLLDHEVKRRGDWAETVDVPPSGWYFEFANEFYPDVDDTAMVLMALQSQFDAESETAAPEEAAGLAASTAAIERGLRWILAMQNSDGGWGAFDRNNDRQFLCYVPFADHNAMIDPSTPDLAGRVLEALGKLGRRVGDKAVDRAVAYVRRSQEADGSWFGRWGVNYIYGTRQALTGLREVGVPPDDPAVVAGVRWLLAHQQSHGGWGESPTTYERPELRGQGPATASQTAWAVLGLVAAGLADHPAVVRGIQYLVSTQRSDGSWEEAEFTGTGFPRVFYLRYHYYPIYFPLLALARWAAQTCNPTT